jgi:hypothetical protein
MSESRTTRDAGAALELAHKALAQLRLDQRHPEAGLAGLYARGKLCPSKRQEVIEIMAELSEELGLQVQTAGLAVTLFDRYTARTWQWSTESKLIAIVAVALAAKFLEVSAPTFGDLSELIGRPRERIQQMELEILEKLGWDLHTATPHTVAEQLFVVVGAPPSVCKRTEFLIDVSYYEHRMLEHSIMEIACAALLLSWVQLDDLASEAQHKQRLAHLCGVRLDELDRCRDTLQRSFNTILADEAMGAASASAPEAGGFGRVSPNSVMAPFDPEPRDAKDAQPPAGSVGGSQSYFAPVA